MLLSLLQAARQHAACSAESSSDLQRTGPSTAGRAERYFAVGYTTGGGGGAAATAEVQRTVGMRRNKDGTYYY